MWSHGSSLTLRLTSSLYYRNVLWVLYGCSAWVVLQSNVFIVVKALILFFLWTHGCRLIRAAIPTGVPIRLIYQGNAWFSEEVQQSPWVLEHVVVLLNTGLWMLLKLSGEGRHRILVVFSDQLTEDEMRTLMWIQMINASP